MIHKLTRTTYYIRNSLVLGASLLLASCNTSVLPTPPLAKVGDTLISVSVKAKGRQLLPGGSRVIVVLADISNPARAPVALGGDSIPMSQEDREVRITFPADIKAMRKCKIRGKCGMVVQVVKNSYVVFSNRKPVPFRLGQKNTIVRVEG